MRTRTILTPVATLGLGALLGWLVASGQLDFNRPLVAAPDPAATGAAVAQSDSAEASGRDQAANDGKKPNILVIMGDDIGWYNPSCYHRGDMGYQTPNIDRIAKEGALFT